MTLRDNIKGIEALSMAALRDKYREVVGLDVRTNNRAYLLKRIVHVLQERAEGGAPLEEPAAAKAHPIAASDPTPPADGRDPRMPAPGTVLERLHDGKVVRVMTLEDGFEYEGRRYRSLSAIAREVTGTIWNGLLFFNLVRRKAPR